MCHAQLASDILSMLSPLLLKFLVEWLGRPSTHDPSDERPPRPLWEDLFFPTGALFGWTCVALLGHSCVAKALLNSHFNWGMASQES